MIKNISNLGDAALYCDFGNEVNKEINSKVIRYFKSIQKQNIDGINNLTPSYNKLIVSYDLRKKKFQDIKKLIDLFTSLPKSQYKAASPRFDIFFIMPCYTQH